MDIDKSLKHIKSYSKFNIALLQMYKNFGINIEEQENEYRTDIFLYSSPDSFFNNTNEKKCRFFYYEYINNCKGTVIL